MYAMVGTPPPPYHMQPNVSPILHVGQCRRADTRSIPPENFSDFKTSYCMQWIIDLLIDKLKNNKQKEWEPEPLHQEMDYDDYCDKCKEEIDEEEKQNKSL